MQSKTSIAILGCEGQIGQEFKYLEKLYLDFKFYFFNRADVDISNVQSTNIFFEKHHFDYIINCAAYTAVDKAESEPEKAYATNTKGCENLANALQNTSTKLVHFSSDYVYHTFDGMPLSESSSTNPQGVYAKSKLEGENILRQSDIPCLILRTSWVISSFGHNFVKTILKISKEKTFLNIVNDQYGAPTYARHLAVGVLDIITQVENKIINIKIFDDTYNFANQGIVTWYQLAKTIVELSQIDCKIIPIPTEEYPTPCTRPKWSVMSLKKYKNTFQRSLPHWREAIIACLQEINVH